MSRTLPRTAFLGPPWSNLTPLKADLSLLRSRLYFAAMRPDSFQSMIDALHQAGLNDSRIAEQTGLARSTIHRYARSEVKAPGFETVTRIAEMHAKIMRPKNTVCGPPLRGKL